MATVQEKIDQLHEKLAKIEMGGGQKRIDSQHKKGKMTARERLAKLFDEGSFTEMGQFIHHRCMNFNMQEKEIPGDGVVTGYGTVRGRLVFAYAEDFTVEGGSLGEMHAHKIAQMQEMALKMGLPSSASMIPAVPASRKRRCLSGFGRIFMNNTAASGVIPQIAVIMGPCAGGAVYSPALMDFVFMVKNTSDMFLTGPAVIKSVTAEEVTAEELGGAMTHSSISGVAHFACENEDDCIEKIKALLDFLPSNNMEEAPVVESDDDPNREDESLNSVIPDNSSMPYDMLDVIKSCVDDGNVFQVLENYALNIITCFARFDGQTVGIIANQPKFLAGCLDINASDKAARFIRFCDSFNIPVVTFVDVPGFLPGRPRNTVVSSATAPRCCMLTVKRRFPRLLSSPARPMAAPISPCAAVSSVPIWSWLGRRQKSPSWALMAQPISSSNTIRKRKRRNRNISMNFRRPIKQPNTARSIASSNRRKRVRASSAPWLCFTANGKNGRRRNTATCRYKEAAV